MTRKDLAFIAATFASLDMAGHIKFVVAEHFANQLAIIHPQFDKRRFLIACGLNPDTGE